jgi:hypothetical protein
MIQHHLIIRFCAWIIIWIAFLVFNRTLSTATASLEWHREKVAPHYPIYSGFASLSEFAGVILNMHRTLEYTGWVLAAMGICLFFLKEGIFKEFILALAGLFLAFRLFALVRWGFDYLL